LRERLLRELPQQTETQQTETQQTETQQTETQQTETRQTKTIDQDRCTCLICHLDLTLRRYCRSCNRLVDGTVRPQFQCNVCSIPCSRMRASNAYRMLPPAQDGTINCDDDAHINIKYDYHCPCCWDAKHYHFDTPSF